MARSTKYAGLICLGMTVLAAIGIVIGLMTGNALVTMFLLLPAVAYEVYRTEGESTRWASWGLLAVFVALLVFFIFRIEFDLAGFLGESERFVRGYQVPLGDVKVVGSALMVILGVVLFTRTRGIYTRWLAAIIFFTSFAIVYILAPDIFERLVGSAIDQVSMGA